MKKITILILILLITVMNIEVIGIEDDYIVKIRVRKARQENEQVNISGKNNFEVLKINDDIEENLFMLNEEKFTTRIDSYYDRRNFKYYDEYSDEVNIGPFHLKLKNSSFNTYEECINRIFELNDEKLDVFAYYNGNEFEIWTGMFINEKTASEEKNRLSDKGIKTEIIKDDNDRIIIYDSSNNVVFAYNNNYNIFFSSYDEELEDSSINIDGKKYRGMIGFYIIDDYKLVTINRVDVESYLYGVVPNEISAQWPKEALKAQAVAARTYAVSNILSSPKYGYDMVDNQNNQVFYGYESEHSSTNDAVNETKGEMIYYSNKLIKAYFHSTSGGKTENSENVWKYSLPYARGVNDEYSNISPYTNWNTVLDQDYIIGKLKEDGYLANKIYDIETKEISENYRSLLTLIKSDCEDVEYEKEQIRRLLGYDRLLSTWFDVDYNNKKVFISAYDSQDSNSNNDIKDEEQVQKNIIKKDDKLYGKNIISANGIKRIDKEKITTISKEKEMDVLTYPTEFYFNGRGWGHGIGMSQYGAKQMAVEGFNYEEIIKHYYTGVEIK